MDRTTSPAAAVPRPRTGELASANLRAEIAKRRISVEAFAKAMGWSKTSAWRKLNDSQPISLDELDRAAAVLDVELVALIEPPRPRQAAS